MNCKLERLVVWLNTPIEVWDIDIGPRRPRLMPRWKLLFAFCESQARRFAWTYKQPPPPCNCCDDEGTVYVDGVAFGCPECTVPHNVNAQPPKVG